jgi:hypothetical protein
MQNDQASCDVTEKNVEAGKKGHSWSHARLRGGGMLNTYVMLKL